MPLAGAKLSTKPVEPPARTPELRQDGTPVGLDKSKMHNGAVKVEFISLCEYAGPLSGSPLNMLGLFSIFEFPEVPVEYRRFYFVIFIKAEPDDYDKPHSIRIRLLDPNGSPTVIDQPFQVAGFPKPISPDSGVRANIVFEVNSMKFTQYGKYQLIVDIDGKRGRREKIQVRKPGESGFVEAKVNT